MENTKQKQFSVSLVYTENIGNEVETAVRVNNLESANDYEALGRTIKTLDDEMFAFVLVYNVVKKVALSPNKL